MAVDPRCEAVMKATEAVLKLEHGSYETGVPAPIWIGKWHELVRALGREPKCQKCGCTEARACRGGCTWLAVELCTKCGSRPF